MVVGWSHYQIICREQWDGLQDRVPEVFPWGLHGRLMIFVIVLHPIVVGSECNAPLHVLNFLVKLHVLVAVPLATNTVRNFI